MTTKSLKKNDKSKANLNESSRKLDRVIEKLRLLNENLIKNRIVRAKYLVKILNQIPNLLCLALKKR